VIGTMAATANGHCCSKKQRQIGELSEIASGTTIQQIGWLQV
jgi:hypothetical protein